MRGFLALLLLGACGGDETPLGQADAMTTFDADPLAPDAAMLPDAGATVVFTADFPGGDGSAWPAPWTNVGGVQTADIQGGRGRLRPIIQPYALARMYVPASERDVEATYTIALAEPGAQGVGFYVRQNGGRLTATTPTGQGYACFVEGFRGARIGVWRETSGNEQELAGRNDPLGSGAQYEAGVPHRVRFQVRQEGPSATRLRCKIWRASQAEPAVWSVDHLDSATPVLQGVSAGYAVDAYCNRESGAAAEDIFFDELVIVRL
jgi:hypothetical protein